MSVVRLAELVAIKGGGTPSKDVPDYWGGDIPWASVKDFKSTELSRTTNFITQAGVENSATNIVPTGSIIVPTRMAVGKAAINTIPMAINQDLKALTPNSKVDTRYLLHALLANAKNLERHATGATVKGITLEVLRGLEIPLPPLEEQRRIAAILDAADALRAKRRAALAKLDTLAQSIFIEMFGDVRNNPEGWAVKTIGDLCKRVTVGIVVKPASYYQEAGVPAVRGTNIKADGIDLSDVVYFSDEDNEGPLSKTRIWKDDLIIVRSGRPGLTAIVPKELDGVNAIDVLIATPDQSQVTSRFLCTLLNSPLGRALVLSESRGQVQQHFNVKSLAGAEIAVPSIDLQQQFCRQLDQLDTARIKSVRSMEKVEALFASLQQRAFRGELTAADEKVAAA